MFFQEIFEKYNFKSYVFKYLLLGVVNLSFKILVTTLIKYDQGTRNEGSHKMILKNSSETLWAAVLSAYQGLPIFSRKKNQNPWSDKVV